MNIGIGSYTYGWASGAYGGDLTRDNGGLSAYELIDYANHFGVAVVQFCIRPALHTMSKEQLRDIALYAENNNVQIEVGTAGIENLDRYIDVANAIGAFLVRLLITNPSESLNRETAFLKGIASKCENLGVSVAIENHEKYRTSDLVNMLAEVDNDMIGVCLDTVNSLGRGEGVQEVTNRLLSHCLNLHLKDFTATRASGNMGFTVTGAALGTGRLPIRWLIGRVAGANPRASIILEQWTPFRTSLDATIAVEARWAREGIAVLKEIYQDLFSKAKPAY